MGTLAELGIDTSRGTVVLVEPPDDVLAEASGMKPRPTIVSSFMHAEPGNWLLWWPVRAEIEPGRLERMHWFLASVAQSEGWIVVDPPESEDGMSADEVRAALDGSKLSAGAERGLASGELAVPVTATF